MTDLEGSQSGRRASAHAVVIGGGFGGLAAAVRLLARGYRVTVLERRQRTGGRAYVYEQDGFTFDAGPTLVTAPYLFEELFALLGEQLSDHIDMRALDPFYNIRFDDGSVFTYSGDARRMREQVRRFSPRDVEAYDRFVSMTEEIFKVGYLQLADVPFHDFRTMARIVPTMIKLESYRSVYGLVAKFFGEEKLRQVFSFHPLLVGGNPFRTTSIYVLIHFLERHWGVHFPMGGVGKLVESLGQLISSHGGVVRTGAEVEEITLEGRRATGVRLTCGESIAADVVVSNADTAWTYKHLLPATARRKWTDRRLRRMKYSMSLFVWYFGTRRRYDDVAHHTILLGPRYRGLLADIFDRKVLADDFSLYLHRPTATDPSLAPPGCDAFYVLSPVPHLESGVDWRHEAERYRQKVSSYLERAVLPGLEKNVVTSHMLTPQGFHDDLLSVHGAAFGMQPVLTQSAYFRPHNKSEDIDRLYIVGASTHPGAGMPGVLVSAKILDKIVPAADAVAA